MDRIPPPFGSNSWTEFSAFNTYALTTEGQYADHPDLVKALAEQLRANPDERRSWLAAIGRPIVVEGVTLTKRDIDQITVLI